MKAKTIKLNNMPNNSFLILIIFDLNDLYKNLLCTMNFGSKCMIRKKAIWYFSMMPQFERSNSLSFTLAEDRFFDQMKKINDFDEKHV